MHMFFVKKVLSASQILCCWYDTFAKQANTNYVTNCGANSSFPHLVSSIIHKQICAACSPVFLITVFPWAVQLIWKQAGQKFLQLGRLLMCIATQFVLWGVEIHCDFHTLLQAFPLQRGSEGQQWEKEHCHNLSDFKRNNSKIPREFVCISEYTTLSGLRNNTWPWTITTSKAH